MAEGFYGPYGLSERDRAAFAYEARYFNGHQAPDRLDPKPRHAFVEGARWEAAHGGPPVGPMCETCGEPRGASWRKRGLLGVQFHGENGGHPFKPPTSSEAEEAAAARIQALEAERERAIPLLEAARDVCNGAALLRGVPRREVVQRLEAAIEYYEGGQA